MCASVSCGFLIIFIKRERGPEPPLRGGSSTAFRASTTYVIFGTACGFGTDARGHRNGRKWPPVLNDKRAGQSSRINRKSRSAIGDFTESGFSRAHWVCERRTCHRRRGARIYKSHTPA